MKKIEKPFASSAIARLTQAETAYELAYKRYSDLKLIRDKLVTGSLSRELYDFINTDGSLEALLPGLPKPSDVACEALTATQLQILDATIAEEALELKKLLLAIWDAIVDWWNDWWDRNRYWKRMLANLQGQYKINPTIFGDISTFAGTMVSMYSHADWQMLTKACQDLNASCKKITAASPANFSNVMETVKVEVTEPLKEFGKYIDEQGVVRSGTPNYTRRENTCGNLRWRYEEVGNYISLAISILGDDIETRRQFSSLERLFKNASGTDPEPFRLAKRIIFTAKENSMHVGRMLANMLNKVIRDRAAMYRMNR